MNHGKLNMRNETKRGRSSNIELYRILVMLLIIAHHYVSTSGMILVAHEKPFAAQSVFLYLFGMWGKTGINCFVMITGYFMCKSNITLKKYAKLVGELVFYNSIIGIIFILLGRYHMSVLNIVKLIIPVSSVSNEFTSAYILFYLFIPFINMLVRNMTRKQHRCLMFLLLFVYTVLGTVPKFDFVMNYISWFLVVYILAAYIRMYPNPVFNDAKKCGLIALLAIFLSMASVVAFAWLHSVTGYSYEPFFVSDSQKPFALVTAVFTFLFFKNIRIPYNRLINLAGASAFGVLLIHGNSNLSQWLWKDLLHVTTMYGSKLLPVHAVLSVIGIFVVGVIIDQIRITFIEKSYLAWVDNWKCKPAIFNIE